MKANDGSEGVQYAVVFRLGSDHSNVSNRVIIVFRNAQSYTIINMKGSKQSYELISCNPFEEWDSHRIEARFKGGHHWLLDF